MSHSKRSLDESAVTSANINEYANRLLGRGADNGAGLLVKEPNAFTVAKLEDTTRTKAATKGAATADVKHSPNKDTKHKENQINTVEGSHRPANNQVADAHSPTVTNDASPPAASSTTDGGLPCIPPDGAKDGQTVAGCTFLATDNQGSAASGVKCIPTTPLDDRKHKQIRDCIVVREDSKHRPGPRGGGAAGSRNGSADGL